MLWTLDIAGKEGSFNGKEGGEIGKLWHGRWVLLMIKRLKYTIGT
jgi:hypothetical protein